eukprot:8723149-Pyramimonas_sp.AAC.1
MDCHGGSGGQALRDHLRGKRRPPVHDPVLRRCWPCRSQSRQGLGRPTHVSWQLEAIRGGGH